MVKYNLHLGYMWALRCDILRWVISMSVFLGIFLIPFILSIFGVIAIKTLTDIIFYAFLSGLTFFVIFMIIGEIWIRLYYDRWFYEFTDSELKLEKGVIYKTYTNIPYERIQNIDIYRGIIARLCNFAAISIQTAGSCGTEGYIPAVSLQSAEKIRDFLMKKIHKKKISGGL